MQTFISYKREDQSFAQYLCEKLRNWGYLTWIDLDNIAKGSYWPDEIDKGLESSDVVIGVVSPEAVRSRNVKNEWDWALTNNKRLLLLLLRPTNMPHRYVSINFIDFVENPQQGFVELHKALAALKQSIPIGKPLDTITLSKVINSAAELGVNDINRERILHKIQNYWIEGVLENTLRDSQFELGVSLRTDVVLRHVDYGDTSLPTTIGILKVFDDLGQALLILGAPGAGKTIVMLQLARNLLNRAREDKTQSIPIVLNLSSWSQKDDSLDDWLIERMKTEYQVSHKLGERWVADERLSLLLDGLDEIRKEYREKCVLAINKFRHRYSTVPIVVSSRISDYGLLTKRLDMNASIVLKPLNSNQIREYLKDPDYTELFQSLRNETALRKMMVTPFLLNTIAYTYRGKSAGGIGKFATEEERINHLFDHYIKRQFAKKQEHKYSLASTKHWLSYLAEKLVRWDESVFYIEDLQPSFSKRDHTLLYIIIISVILSVSGYAITSLLLLFPPLIYFTALGIAFIVVFQRTTEWEDTIENVRAEVVIGFVAGFLLCLINIISGLLFIVIFLFARRLARGILFGVEPLGSISWIYNRSTFVVGTVFIILTIAAGLSPLILGIGLILVILTGLQKQEMVSSGVYPNAAIRQSARNALVISFLTTIAFTLLLGFSSFRISLAIGLASGLLNGGIPVLQHFALRVVSTLAKDTPWNYAGFLDFAVSLTLLRRVGGGYIFSHRMLLEYFAGLESKKGKEESN